MRVCARNCLGVGVEATSPTTLHETHPHAQADTVVVDLSSSRARGFGCRRRRTRRNDSSTPRTRRRHRRRAARRRGEGSGDGTRRGEAVLLEARQGPSRWHSASEATSPRRRRRRRRTSRHNSPAGDGNRAAGASSDGLRRVLGTAERRRASPSPSEPPGPSALGLKHDR